MTTWVVGDIHGCADELAALVEKLGLGEHDLLVSVGDLFHRGPDPAGVMRILSERRARFVLGNHEYAVLRRLGLGPPRAGLLDPNTTSAPFENLRSEDLAGDGGEPCAVSPQDRPAIVRFLMNHSGFFLRRAQLPGAAPLPDGREWMCIHAGLLPGLTPEQCSIDVLTRLRRLDARGRPWWYESHTGPDLVLFGHTPSKFPRVHRHRGEIVALGLDTGCVYGGVLTAYSPELDEFASVPAACTYART